MKDISLNARSVSNGKGEIVTVTGYNGKGAKKTMVFTLRNKCNNDLILLAKSGTEYSLIQNQHISILMVNSFNPRTTLIDCVVSIA